MQNEQETQQENREKFGRYGQIRRVGRGGMGEVWLCKDTLLHRKVAIKTLPPHNQLDQDYLRRFEREAQAAAALNHPHILAIHDYGTQAIAAGELTTYLVMPYIAGGSLADLIKQLASQHKGIGLDQALLFLTQAAEAIDYAHTQGMVHRDIKPANMLLNAEDWLLISDFGLVQIVSDSDDLTKEGVIVGTPVYMAPEQARGHAEAASDIYSLAVIAYQLFLGRPPFHAETSFATIMQHILLPPPMPRLLNPDLPVACEEVLLRGLAKQPAERFPSARLFVEELTSSFGITDPKTPPITLQQGNGKTLSRRKVLVGAGVGLVALGAGTGLWRFTANRGTNTSVKPAIRQEEPAMILREHLASPEVLTWVPSKNILASACDEDATLKLWDIDSFLIRQQPEYESTRSLALKGTNIYLAWSPDGRYLAVANSHTDSNNFNQSSIDMYDATLTTIKGFEKGLTVPILSVDGLGWLYNRFPVAIWNAQGAQDEHELGMWDVMQPALNPQSFRAPGLLSTLPLGLKSQSLPVSPDGKQVAFSTDGIVTGTIALENNKVSWRPNKQPKLKLYILYGGSSYLCWGLGGRRIMAINDAAPFNIVIGWEFSGSTSSLLRFGIPADAPDFTVLVTHPSPTSRMFAAGTTDGKIYLWSGTARELPIRTLTSPEINEKVLALSWSPNGQWLAASYADINATILIWKI